jgi:hypothetical protein
MLHGRVPGMDVPFDHHEPQKEFEDLPRSLQRRILENRARARPAQNARPAGGQSKPWIGYAHRERHLAKRRARQLRLHPQLFD